MTRYFLDTNILLDFLGNRQPFGKYALEIFNKSRLKEWQLWTSDNSILTSYYIISKEIGEAESRIKIGRLINYLEIQPTQKAQILQALNSDFKDLEDAVQYFCASSISKLEGIITRNKKDFKSSQIPVFEPWEVV
ncbi:MAG: toxin-antitoxin system PIN family toxin component [Algoriphagus marincola HL-49]|uniref:Toxin-antitoxin system PIN family toxin component n=1 Tax=Algoriphagus marincola HL-49 TaxID=1305737 RepID=A0A0P8AS59_9BACT|nr:MAG: toxin-antitoxin system PIN family toxin component [Algoriphagus marincola HL-49]